ncbi:glycoside hydrolase family 78 protein [Desulfoscipio gibsoniae]
MKRMKRILLSLFFFFVFVFFGTGQAQAVTILNEEFEGFADIDTEKTSAFIDAENGWARLPEAGLSSAISVLRDSPGYLVASAEGIRLYEYDDATGGMAYNSVFSVPYVTTATGVAVDQDSLNVWAITPDSLTYYKHNGASMSLSLEVTGLANIISVAGVGGQDSALILQRSTNNKAVISRFNDGSAAPDVTLSPEISDPIAISAVGNSPDFRLFTGDSSYYFFFDDATGNYIQDPGQKISGLGNVVAGSSDEYGSAVLSKSSLDYYINMDGGGTAQVSAFSPGDVGNAVSAALRPGYFEQIVLDGDGNIQWWTYDDATDSMRRDLDMETSGFILNNGYVTSAEYFSKEMVSDREYSLVRLSSELNMPSDTILEWFISVGHGNSFIPIILDEWTAVDPSTSFIVKCVLDTADSHVTPYIFNVILDLNSQPDAPTVTEYGSCFMTSTPKLTWTFTDPDHPVPGDAQSAYQLQIVNASDLSQLIIDTGKAISNSKEYIVPTSTQPDVAGPLWNSGNYNYKYRVRVWDQADIESPWSDYADFCVIAFDRPRISQIASVPLDKDKPDLIDLTTHKIITPGMTEDELPMAKAGAKVSLLIDVIGPLNSITPKFPYTGPKGEETSCVIIQDLMPDGMTSNPLNPGGSKTNRWSIDFWTDPSLEICPPGTLVEMQLTGTGSEGDTQLNAPPYAAGIIKTNGSVYEDWIVVPHGRDS